MSLEQGWGQPAEIANVTAKDKASVTYVLDNLVKRKLVYRQEGTDRRNKIIFLTNEGKMMKKKVQPWIRSLNNTAKNEVPPGTVGGADRGNGKNKEKPGEVIFFDPFVKFYTVYNFIIKPLAGLIYIFMKPEILVYTAFTETSHNALQYACEMARDRDYTDTGT